MQINRLTPRGCVLTKAAPISTKLDSRRSNKNQKVMEPTKGPKWDGLKAARACGHYHTESLEEGQGIPFYRCISFKRFS